MRWHPSWEDIQEWLTAKEHEFSPREIQLLMVNINQWKDRYLYTDMHDILFTEFPCLLVEWLKRKTATNSTVWPFEPVVWDEDKLEELRALDNKWTRAIEF
jgi:hypothetical protein